MEEIKYPPALVPKLLNIVDKEEKRDARLLITY